MYTIVDDPGTLSGRIVGASVIAEVTLCIGACIKKVILWFHGL